jgi:ankyrin repeat protein
MAAAMSARFTCLTILLRHLADPNIVLPETGSTALMLASSVGAAMCVEELLRAGAVANAANLHGDSALHMAAALGAKGKTAVHHLLAHGADPELENDAGVTPLAVARDAGFADIAQDMLRFEHVEEVQRIKAAAAEAEAATDAEAATEAAAAASAAGGTE